MPDSSVYNLLQKMDADNIVLAYKGEINSTLLESVYSMMNTHLEKERVSSDKKKKFFHLLIESLQNVFHHQVEIPPQLKNDEVSAAGFIIKSKGENSFSIITGNYLLNSGVDVLKGKLDEVNKLSPAELKNHYRELLAGNEFSEKGGAGLGIIEMARKSGNKLDYEFTKINNEYSFFTLTIVIP